MPERVALVTGGNRGLGMETCRQLAQQGYRVVLGSRDESRGREAASAMEGEVAVLPLDVGAEGAAQQAYDYISRKYGRLDVLVNNAGVYDMQQIRCWPCR